MMVKVYGLIKELSPKTAFPLKDNIKTIYITMVFEGKKGIPNLWQNTNLDP